MNILHIMKDYKPNIGGSVVRNSGMIDNYYKKYEDRIILLDLDGSLYDKNSNEDGIEVIRCTSLKEMIREAVRITKEEKIDVIHTHNFRFLLVGYICKLIKKKVKLIVELHAIYSMNKAKEVLSYYLLRKADAIIVLAESAKAHLLSHLHLDDEKIYVIRNGLTQSIQKVTQDSDLTDLIREKRTQYIILAYSGSFIEWQGVNFISNNFDKILEKNPNVFLLMVGNGPEYEYVTDKMQTCKFQERLLIHPAINKSQMNGLLQEIDIVLIPRQKNLCTNTAIPLKVVEAMQEGKCILSADDNGLTELLNDGNARIFEAENTDSLIFNLKQLTDSADLRLCLAKKAQQDVQTKLVSWEENAKAMRGIYLKI